MTFEEYSDSGKSFRDRVRDFFTRPSNPKNMKVLGGLILVGLLIGLVGWSLDPQNSVFHSSNIPPKPSLPDPSTILWNGKGNNLGEFNQLGATYVASGFNVAQQAIRLTATSGQTAIAISKTQLVDLSLVSGKNLAFQFSWSVTSGCCTAATTFGWFLTENNTIPTGSYNPYNDPSVVLLDQIQSPLGGSPASYSFNYYLNHNIGQTSVGSADNGFCGGSGSCFVNTAYTITPTTSGEGTNLDLNFTGTTGPGSCSGTNGPGCSYDVESQGTVNPPVLSSGGATNLFPQISLTGQYYVGFYSMYNLGSPVDWFFQICTGSSTVCMVTYSFLPPGNTITPSIDTGGFFGPIIRALISIGVFIAKNVIGFFVFLAGVAAPVLAQTFAVLAAVLVTVLNAIGNFLTIGPIGTFLQNFFSGIGSFLVNVAGSIYTNLLALVNFFAQIVSILGSLFTGNVWGLIINFVTLVAGGAGTLLTGLGYMIQFGGLGINYAFLADWFYGMFMLSRKGIEGFKGWIDFNGIILGLVAKGGQFFISESIQMIVRLKQLIAQWL